MIYTNKQLWPIVEPYLNDQPATVSEIAKRAAMSRPKVGLALRYAAYRGLVSEHFRDMRLSDGPQSLYSTKPK